VEIGNVLIECWKDFKTTDEVDVDIYLTHATLDLLGRTVLGTKFNSLSGTKCEIAEILDVKLGNMPIWYRLLAPHFSFVTSLPLKYIRNLNSKTARVREIMKIVIDARRTDRFQQSNERDLLDLMLNANQDGEELDEQEIIDEAATFLFAGSETTSSMLMWLFYELSHNLDVLKNLQNEIDTIVGNAPPTPDDLPKLKYLNMVINETLRLHTPTAVILRMPQHDTVILGYTIPKGTKVVVSPYIVHMSEKYWEDATVFKASRWENIKEEEVKEFFPFSSGPRSCIGRNFALLEIKTLVCMIVQKYELKVADNQKIVPNFNFTVRPSSLKMNITKRNK